MPLLVEEKGVDCPFTSAHMSHVLCRACRYDMAVYRTLQRYNLYASSRCARRSAV